MKKTIQILLLLLSFSAISQQNTEPINFMVLTPEIGQLKPILLAAEELKADGDFKIVLYGKNVPELLTSETKKFIEQAEKLNVKLSVCKISLDMLQINPNALPKEIEVVDNAFLYALQLQKKGYKILSL